MRVIVAMEVRFVQDPAGGVWSATMDPSFWKRYHTVFDEVVVAARVLPAQRAETGWHRVDRPGVTFHPIPYYVGPAQFLRQSVAIRRSVSDLVQPGDAVVLRIGSQVAAMIEPALHRAGHPYAVEVVGDPHDVFAAGAVRHPLRRLFRWHFARQMRRQCRRAVAVAYVTEHALQRRYPASPGAFTTHYSSIDLPASAYVDAPRIHLGRRDPLRLIFVGSLAQMYKAPDILVQAVARCRTDGLELELDLVGGGKDHATVSAMVTGLDLGDRVRLHGEVTSGEPIRRLLDAADLFVLPSRTEGLPRSMIEAMARGLPCIGSTVGGIPELLEAEDLVPPGDAEELARTIAAVAADPARMDRMAARNLGRSRAYAAPILRDRRDALYGELRRRTAAFAGQEAAS